MLLGFTFAESDAYAHTPTSVSLSPSADGTQVTITWVHLGTAGANGCGSGCGLGDDKRFVDVMRDAVNIVNNSTAQTFTDASLSQGQEYGYLVCHGDPSTATCAAADVNETNSGLAAKVWTTTKASAVTDGNLYAGLAHDISLSAGTNNIVVTWAGPGLNNTNTEGLQIEYSSDGGASFTTATSNSSAINNRIPFVEYDITGLQSSTEYLIRVAGVTEANSATGNTGSAVICTNCNITTQNGDNRGKTLSPSPQAASYSNGDVTGGNLKVTLQEDRGWDRILSATLYTNITEGGTIADSDTSITWHYFDGVTVIDPNNYFNEVNVVTEQSGVRTMDVTYEISWNRSLAKSNAILVTSDFPGNVGTTGINEAWKSFPDKKLVSHEIPEETSEVTTMALFDGGIMNHLLLNNDVNYILNDMQYFVPDTIIDVSQDEKVVVQKEDGLTKQIFEKFTLSHDNVKIGHKYSKTLVITGIVKGEFYQGGEPVIFSISNPDGAESQISAVTTTDRTFQVPIIVDKFESGVYQFTPSHGNLLGEPFSYRQ